MKKLFFILLLCFGIGASVRNADAQAVQIQKQMNVTATTTGNGFATPTTFYHQISWTVQGTVATCSFTADSSPDNSSWTTGGVIAATTCTSGGVTSLANAVTNFTRLVLGTFTCTGTCSINISYTGYGSIQTPGPTAPFSTLTDAATVTWATASASVANASLLFTAHSGSRTLNVTGLVNGGTYVLKIIQDATGGEGLTLGTGCTWKVSGGGTGAITPSTGANAIDVIAFMYDGTNCYANFNKNFN
jgi:hypothetical protein